MVSRKTIRLMIIAAITILIAGVIYYIATHGRIVIKNQSDSTVSLVSLDNQNVANSSKKISNGAFLRAGTYVIRNDENKSLRLATVTVRGWLQTSEISYTGLKTAKVSRVAALTYENFFPGINGSFYSYTDLNGYTSGYTTHQAADAFGGKATDSRLDPELGSPIATGDGSIVGLTDGSLSRYTIPTKQTTPLTDIKTELTSDDILQIPKVQRSSDIDSTHIGVYQGSEKELDIINADKVTKVSPVVSGTQNIVFDVNSRGWAMVKNTSSTNANSRSEDKLTLPYDVTYRIPSSDKNRTITLGEAQSVSAVALSPDAKYIALIIDNHLSVYDTTSKALVIANPYTNASQLLWRGTKLYALSTDMGVMVFDTTSKQLSPINFNANGILSFSKAVPFGSKLYVTAYNSKNDAVLPDGYVIDLDTPSDGTTEALAEKLPFSDSDAEYDISYLENTIYVRINYISRSASDTGAAAKIESIKKTATEKIKSLLSQDILDRCKIVYVN